MTEPYRVPAVRAAAAVLRALLARQSGRGASQAELVKATGISKSSMHHLLATLVDERMVVRHERTREYTLGPMLVALGAVATAQTTILAAAREALAPLAADHGLSFAVAHRTAPDRVEVVERFYPPQDVHVGVMLGAEFGPFDGALGKCILADMDPDEAEALVRSHPLHRHTERTITDASALLAEVEHVRRAGWAASRQELNDNNAVSARVTGPSGRAEAFVFALGFPSQLTDSRIVSVGNLLRDIAIEIGGECRAPQTDYNGDGTAQRSASRTRAKERA